MNLSLRGRVTWSFIIDNILVLTLTFVVFDFLNNRETIAARTRRTKKRGVVQHAKLKKESENLKLASRPTTVDKNVRSIRDVL